MVFVPMKSHLFMILLVTPQALHVQPNDKAVMYNIAMIQQKAAEMLFAINPSKRTSKDLQRAIDGAGHAQKCDFFFRLSYL